MKKAAENRLNLIKILNKITGMKNVLFVDDEEHNRNSFRANFRKLYNVLTANSVDEAEDVLENQHVDFAIIDHRMPKVKGWELMEWIRLNHPEIPSVMISAYPEDLKGKNTEVLPKPFNIQQIIEKIG